MLPPMQRNATLDASSCLPLNGSFLNTKQNSITLADYAGAKTGGAGPALFSAGSKGAGWKQIATHAGFFEVEDRAAYKGA